MTTSPYDALPTWKQALAPASSESIEEKPPIPGSIAVPSTPGSSAKISQEVSQAPQSPDPITDPYGGYEEISLEEAARLATPAMTPSPRSGGSPAATRNFTDPVSAKPAVQQASAPNAAARRTQPAAEAETIVGATSGNADTPHASGDNAYSSKRGFMTENRNAENQESKALAGSGTAAPSVETPLETELHYDNVCLRNRKRIWEYVLPFEETLLVPDTMPDMIQILFSEGRATPSQPGQTHYSSSDTYSGEILLFTVYRPDGGTDAPVDVVRSTIAFETNACWGASDPQNPSGSQPESDLFYYATVHLKEAEPSRLNERKFQVRGKLCITVTEIRETELHVLRGAGDKDLILKQETMEVADLVFETEEFADVEQEIAVEEGQPQPTRLLKESFAITETHRQIASGKLIISGLLQTQMLYLGEDDDGEERLCCRSEKTEFTQFIPLQNQLDCDLIKVDFSTDGLNLAIENQDTFRLEGQVRIQIHGYGNRQIPMASDAYHKEKAIHFEREAKTLSCLTGVLSGEISAREVASLTEEEQHPDRLICGSILPGEISAHPEHGRIVVEGSVPVRILALDEDGRAFAIESEVPLRGALDASASAETLQTADLFACSATKDFWIDAINSRQIEINVSASIEVWISRNREFTSLEHFTAEAENPQQPAMVIYITSAGDSFWDIARHYQCDTDALVQLNEIDGDAPLTEGTKLLIVR